MYGVLTPILFISCNRFHFVVKTVDHYFFFFFGFLVYLCTLTESFGEME